MITIDMDFFGSKAPINWSPKDRMESLKEVLNVLKAENITLVISKSDNPSKDSDIDGRYVEYIQNQK